MFKTFRLDFVSIGCARSGTTWLRECLQEHPQICVSDLKELCYFCSDPQWAPFSNNFRSENWLNKRFSHYKPGQIKGELTPFYISDPTSPVLIKKAFPDIKILVSYRNPVDRLYSMYYISMSFFSMLQYNMVSFKGNLNNATIRFWSLWLIRVERRRS